MDIRVECYSGYRGEETPQVMWLGSRRIAVKRILDRWLAPDHRYFKLRGDDGGVYIIRHDVATLEWQLTFYQDPDMEPPPDPGPARGTS